jgi:hypothetical protein
MFYVFSPTLSGSKKPFCQAQKDFRRESFRNWAPFLSPVLEYLPTALKITQFCRSIYQHHGQLIWDRDSTPWNIIQKGGRAFRSHGYPKKGLFIINWQSDGKMMIWEKAVLGNFHICVLMVSDCSICRPKSQQLAGKWGTLVWSGLTIGTWCTHHDYNSPWLKMICLYCFMGKFTIWGSVLGICWDPFSKSMWK